MTEGHPAVTDRAMRLLSSSRLHGLARVCSTARARAFACFAMAALCLLAGCGRASPERATDAGAGAGKDEELVVFAAASLRESFGRLADELKRGRPGARVSFNFAGSQDLRTQIEHGAAADVFASADIRHMNALSRAGAVERPVIFARSEPVIIVPKGQLSGIQAIADLPNAARIVVGAPEVPIGGYTLAILDKASLRFGGDFRSRVEARVASRELNVRQVLAKVSLGEADAGIVYRTDAAAAIDKVEVIDIPADLNVVAEYPIATVTGAPHQEIAKAWVELVMSNAGQDILARAGFMTTVGASAKGP